MVLTLIVQLVLLVSDDLSVAQAMMFILGTTFAGKSIIGIAYLIEYMTVTFVANIVFI